LKNWSNMSTSRRVQRSRCTTSSRVSAEASTKAEAPTYAETRKRTTVITAENCGNPTAPLGEREWCRRCVPAQLTDRRMMQARGNCRWMDHHAFFRPKMHYTAMNCGRCGWTGPDHAGPVILRKRPFVFTTESLSWALRLLTECSPCGVKNGR